MAQSGSLTVQVFASRAQLPVEGAAVVVTRPTQSGKQEVLALQETDRSGNTRPIRIPTPELQQSTQPRNLTSPFTRCDIRIEHPDYELLLVEGVQIFPGVESVQMAELTPLVQGEVWTQRPSIRPIPAQDL